MKWLGLALVVGAVCWIVILTGDWLMFYNFPALVFVLVYALGCTLISGIAPSPVLKSVMAMPNDKEELAMVIRDWRSIGQFFIWGGWVSFIMGVFSVLYFIDPSINPDPFSVVFIALAICCLSIFYGYFFAFSLCFPLQKRAERYASSIT